MRIALFGDVMLGRLVNKMLKHNDPAYPWGNTLSGLPHPRYFTFVLGSKLKCVSNYAFLEVYNSGC